MPAIRGAALCGAAAMLVCLLAYGGAVPGPRAAVHALIAAGLGFLLSAGPGVHQASGAALRLAAAGLLVLLTVLTGFLPIPSFLGRILSPAWSVERGEALFALSSLSPMDTLDAATMVVLAFSMAIVAGALPFRRRAIGKLLRAHTLLLMLCVATIAGSATPLYAEYRFAPFVDSNHFGTALLVGLPFIADAVLDNSRAAWERITWALVVAVAAAALYQSHVLMPILLGGLGCIVTLAMRWRPAWALIAVGVPATALTLLVSGMRGGVSHGRFPVWVGSAKLWTGHWALGSGAGTFATAVEPYRVDKEFHIWNHAHNDFLQVLAETGLIGATLVALAVALFLFAARAPRPGLPGHRQLVVLGLGLFLLQATIEFPFRLPYLAMTFAVVTGAWLRSFHRFPAVPATVTRTVLGTALTLNLVAGAATGWQSVVLDSAEEVLKSAGALNAENSEAHRRLELVAPLHRALQIDEAARNVRLGQQNRATLQLESLLNRYFRDPMVTTTVARLAVRNGDLPLAVRAAELSTTWNPSSFYNWEVRAQVVTSFDPDRAPDVWRDALLAGSPKYEQAFKDVPSPLLWASMLASAPVPMQLRMASQARKNGHEEEAMLLFDHLYAASPGLASREYATLLNRAGRHTEALEHIERLPARARRGADVLRIRAVALEASGSPEAVPTWFEVAEVGGRPKDRAHALQLMADRLGRRQALTQLDRMEADGIRPGNAEYMFAADLHRQLGNSRLCAQTLAKLDYSASGQIERKAEDLRRRCAVRDDADGPDR